MDVRENIERMRALYRNDEAGTDRRAADVLRKIEHIYDWRRLHEKLIEI